MTKSRNWRTARKFPAFASNRGQLLRAVVVLVVLVISVFLISKSLSIRFEQYQQYRDAIVKLKELDSKFNQEILKSRYELFASYDPLVENLRQQQTIQQQLQNIPDFVDARGKQDIEEILKERKTLLEQKQSLSERFKSRNALLKNSLRYLPLLTNQLEEKFEAQEKQAKNLEPEQISALRTTLNRLIRNLLLYNVAVDEKLSLEIETLTKQLSQLETKYELTEDQFPSQLVKSHSTIILNTKPQVEQLTTQLSQSLEQQTKALEKPFISSYQRAVSRVNRYRLLTYGWFLMLLISINYFLLKSSRQANPGLAKYKQQIEQVTAALAQVLAAKDGSSKFESVSELVSLAKRKDELGQLAQGVEQMAEQVKKERALVGEESFAFLTARLSLLTKNRRELITPEAWQRLEIVFGNTLEARDCQLIDFQGAPEQIQLLFSYSPQVQISQLVAHLKTVSSSFLYQEFRDVVGNIGEPSQIWSDAYFISSCEGGAEGREQGVGNLETGEKKLEL